MRGKPGYNSGQEVDLATYTPACLPSPEDTTAYDGKMALAVGSLIFGSSAPLGTLENIFALYIVHYPVPTNPHHFHNTTPTSTTSSTVIN